MPLDIEELRQLPVADKLRIVEQLWDDIASSESPFPLHEWHKQEAQRRAAELEANPQIALTRQEVWRRVDGEDG